MGLLGGSGGKDKDEGAMDKAKARTRGRARPSRRRATSRTCSPKRKAPVKGPGSFGILARFNRLGDVRLAGRPGGCPPSGPLRISPGPGPTHRGVGE